VAPVPAAPAVAPQSERPAASAQPAAVQAEPDTDEAGDTGGQTELGERVVETLTDAVRQRIREALSGSTSTGTAAERREHGKIDTGDTVPDDGTNGSKSAQDPDGPGPDAPGSSPFSAGNDAGI
jgi:hypothetical protein